MALMDDLIARLEAASEGSEDLNEAVALATGWEQRWHEMGPVLWHEPGMAACLEQSLPTFTISLDAALTLLPEGWWVQHIGHNLGGWGCRIETQGKSIPASVHIPRFKTPALALCITALKARAVS